TRPLIERFRVSGWLLMLSTVCASRLRVTMSAWSSTPFVEKPVELSGLRRTRFWFVYASVPRLVLRLPHENGVTRRPRLTMTRLVLALILSLLTLKYGLSSSVDAVWAVTWRRAPSGVR